MQKKSEQLVATVKSYSTSKLVCLRVEISNFVLYLKNLGTKNFFYSVFLVVRGLLYHIGIYGKNF